MWVICTNIFSFCVVSCSCFLMYLLFVCVELPDPVTFRAQSLRQLAVLILWSNSQGVPAWCTLHNNTLSRLRMQAGKKYQCLVWRGGDIRSLNLTSPRYRTHMYGITTPYGMSGHGLGWGQCKDEESWVSAWVGTTCDCNGEEEC